MNIFSFLDHIEFPLIKTFQNLDGLFLDPFWKLVSNVPAMIVFCVVMTSLISLRHPKFWRPLIVSLAIALIVHVLINEGFFKTFLVHFEIFRPRPWTIHPDILAIGYPFHDSSFPSSHMAFTSLITVIFTSFRKWFLPYGIGLIILMGLSRVHNGMHYPSDVFVGTIMGLMYGFFALWLMRKMGIEKKTWWQRMKERFE